MTLRIAPSAAARQPTPTPATDANPERLLCEHGEEECVCTDRTGCRWAYPAKQREKVA